jgi:hypothetical protein
MEARRTMSADGAFMFFNGRRVEWEMLHPAFKGMFAFNVHGAELCLQHNIHPMFPSTEEICRVNKDIRVLEDSLL